MTGGHDEDVQVAMRSYIDGREIWSRFNNYYPVQDDAL